MLILTRKLGEGIMIGADVLVRVIDVKGGQVKLGIDAPHKTSVHREEVYQRICQENLRAAAHMPAELEGVMRSLLPDEPEQGDDDEGSDRA